MDDCNTVIGEIVEAKQAKDEKLYFVREKFVITRDKNQRSEKEEKEKIYPELFQEKRLQLSFKVIAEILKASWISWGREFRTLKTN